MTSQLTNGFSNSAFSDFESMVDYFVSATGTYFPKLYRGRDEFFSGFSNWLHRPVRVEPQALLTPDPAQGLAMPDALQIITAAMVGYDSAQADIKARELLLKYGLCEQNFTQSVNTLSGGELLLLNYAKAEAQLPYVERLTACNPLFWLNPSRHHFWKSLCDTYAGARKPVHSLLIDDSMTGKELTALPGLANHENVKFSLLLNDSLVRFPEVQFPVYHAERQIRYVFAPVQIEATSPMLITGDNGVGKSLLARLLAGIYQADQGAVLVQGSNNSRVVRLLFQESISQLFTLGQTEYLQRTFSAAPALHKRAHELLCEFFSLVNSGMQSDASLSGSSSLLHAKTALIAARLAESPALLLLDEPAWGLSRTAACRLVNYCCQLAHRQGTSVAIISHQPEWHASARCNLYLQRQAEDCVEITCHEIS